MSATSLTVDAFGNARDAPEPERMPTVILQYLGAYGDKFIVLSDGEFKETVGVISSVLEDAKHLKMYDVVSCQIKFHKVGFALLRLRLVYSDISKQIGEPRPLERDVAVNGQTASALVDRKIPRETLKKYKVQEEIVVNRANTVLQQATNQSHSELYFTPISQISLASKSWVVRARIGYKTRIMTYPKGCMFKCLIFDASGQAELLFYSDLCNKYFESIAEDKIYIISNADPIQACKYNTSGNSIELKMTHRSEIIEDVRKDQDIPLYPTPAPSLKVASDRSVPSNVLQTVQGVVIDVTEKESLTTKTGNTTYKQLITLADENLDCIHCLLWGDVEGMDQVSKFEVIVLQNVKKSEYMGSVKLSSDFKTRIRKAVNISSGLQEFARQVRSTQVLPKFLNLSESVEKMKEITNLHDVFELSKQITQENNKKLYFISEARVIEFGETITRKACPHPNCFESVKWEVFKNYECPIHGELLKGLEPIHRFAARIVFKDDSGILYTMCFSDSVGMTIYGRSAEEIAHLADIDREHHALQHHLSTRKGKIFRVGLYCQMNTYQDKSSVNIKLTSAEEIMSSSKCSEQYLAKRSRAKEEEEMNELIEENDDLESTPIKQVMEQQTNPTWNF